MNLIIDEYDRLLIQNGGKSKSKGEDAAFSSDGNSRKGKHSDVPGRASGLQALQARPSPGQAKPGLHCRLTRA